MISRIIFLALIACSLGHCSDFEVTIVPTRVTEENQYIGGSQDRHFSVIIKNISDRKITVWREWCSWGYYSVWFTIVQKNGTTFSLTKGDGAWSWNVPDATVVFPGKYIVRTVDFSDQKWSGFPEGYRNQDVVVIAHFGNPGSWNTSDKDLALAKKFNIWIGEASSESQTFHLEK